MTDTEKAEYDNIVRLLTEKLRETVDENDKLRALVANLTEGASAHDTLSELHRNRDLPAAIRAKAAIGCLGVESAPLKSVEPPLELTAEPVIPLADLVRQRRAYVDALEREELQAARNNQIVPFRSHSNGNGSDDDTGS